MSSRGSNFPSGSTLSWSRPARCMPSGGYRAVLNGIHLLRPLWHAGHLSAKKLKLKRTASSSNGRRKICKRRVKEVTVILSDESESVVKNPSPELCWYELTPELATKLSPSIVSLASFDGDEMHYKCTGIVVRNSSLSGASVLTSSALVSTSDTKCALTPKIKLRLPNKEVVDGWIQHYNLPFSMVVITTEFSPDLSAACVSNSLKVDHTHLLAVKRCYDSGKLMKTYGEPIDSSSEVDIERFMDGSFGPLVDYAGNIVAMNYCDGQEITRCVQTNKILEYLSDLWFSDEEVQNISVDFVDFEPYVKEFTKDKSTPEFTKEKSTPEFTKATPTRTEDEHKHLNILDPWPSDDYTKKVDAILRSNGYPLPKYDDDGMHVKNSFEEEFDTHMWSKHTRKVALMMSKSIVALASFDDKERHFACTGVLLDCNESTSRVLTSASLVRTSGHEDKIVDNLRIEARLPEEKPVIGKLLHHDLSYNVAVLSIPVFSKNHAAISVEATQTKVVALGRAFRSGNLMATDGLLIGQKDKFDCRELKFSNCKITKAGIGGPLYDLNGNFVGMNFYDDEGTPYLPRDIIMKVLESFDAERAVAAGITDKPNYRAVAAGITDKPNYRWPVPQPYWYYPSEYEEESEPEMLFE